MTETVERTMLARDIMPRSSALVGLSGGADSAALAHILSAIGKKRGFKVYAAHINHGLRGEAADRDEEFSRELAKKLGIEFFCLHADIRADARRLGIGEEDAGRRARYGFFDELMKTRGIECTATAHHKNDNAETILMNFIRGSGVKGLCGIPYKRDRIIRPLLDVSRAEIEEYCRENSIDYVTDESNLAAVYTRNKTRHIIIPEIERHINPSFADTVTKNAAVLAADEDFLSGEARRAYTKLVSDGSADASALAKLHPAIASRVARLMISDICGTENVSSRAVAAAVELAKRNRTGSRADIARGARAEIEYGRLYIKRETAKNEGFCCDLSIGGSRHIPEIGCSVRVEHADEMARDGWEYFGLPRPDCRIQVRNRRPGDRFVPFGMTGSKSVKEYMINEKIPRDRRGSVPIVTFDEEIAWIAGYRRDNRFKFNKNGIKMRLEY